MIREQIFNGFFRTVGCGLIVLLGLVMVGPAQGQEGIDPCLQLRLRGGDVGPNFFLGDQIELNGDVMVFASDQISSPTGRGIVTIYRRSGEAWIFEQKLFGPEGNGPFAGFGSNVSVCGDDLMVTDRGRNVVYHYQYLRVSKTWVLRQTLTGISQNDLAFVKFGWHVQIDNDVVVILGFLNSLQQASFNLYAIVFRRNMSSSHWEREAALPITNQSVLGIGDQFEYVAVSGDVIAASIRGLTWMYRYQGDTEQWVKEAELNSGYRVDLDGDLFVAYSRIRNSVEVFRYRDGNWGLESSLPAPSTSFHGRTVAVDGDKIYLADSLATASGVAVLRFHFDGQNWTKQSYALGEEQGITPDAFGLEFAVDGESVAILENIQDFGDGLRDGLVLVYNGVQSNDCNDNGLNDACETSAGVIADIDLNLQPDECQTDCNLNGIPDSFEINRLAVDSGWQNWKSGEAVPSVVIVDPPVPTSLVEIEVRAITDLSGTDREVGVLLNGIQVARLFQDTGTACSSNPDVGSFFLLSDFFRFIVSLHPEGHAVISLRLPPEDDGLACGEPSAFRISVSYDAPGNNDVNANGVPDECDPPMCEGLEATVYVDRGGYIVGGLFDGRRYFGILIGTRGDDVIVGTEDDDIIIALTGDDIICGNGGEDIIVNPMRGYEKPQLRKRSGMPITSRR